MESLAKKLRDFLLDQEESYREVQSLLDGQDHMETIPEMPLEESTYRESIEIEVEYMFENIKTNESKLLNAYKEQLIQLADELKNAQCELIDSSQEIYELKNKISILKIDQSKIESLNKSLTKERGEKAAIIQKNENLMRLLQEKEAIIDELRIPQKSPEEISYTTKSSTKYYNSKSDNSFSSGGKSKDGAMMELVKFLQKKDEEVDRLRLEISRLKKGPQENILKKEADSLIQTNEFQKNPSPKVPNSEKFYKKKPKWVSNSIY